MNSLECKSPIVLTPKYYGGLPLCFGYRIHNNKTIPDTYHLPLMDFYIDTLEQETFLTTLGASSWYLEMPFDPHHIYKMTFPSICGFFCYKRMPLGLRDAQATFQRGLDIILTYIRWKTFLVSLDDVIIFSKSI